MEIGWTGPEQKAGPYIVWLAFSLFLAYFQVSHFCVSDHGLLSFMGGRCELYVMLLCLNVLIFNGRIATPLRLATLPLLYLWSIV